MKHIIRNCNYQKSNHYKILTLDQPLAVTWPQIGLVNCTFLLEDTPFEYKFIVCRNLTRPLILGRDFLIQNHIAVRYSDKGKRILDHQ